MEKLKEEAISNLREAKRKLEEKDFSNARILAIQAKSLDPQVEGVDILLERINFCQNLYSSKGIAASSSRSNPPPALKIKVEMEEIADENNGPGPGPGHEKKSRKIETFWTSCTKCLRTFEYRRSFKNCQVFCNECCILFIAYEIEMPTPPSPPPPAPSVNKRKYIGKTSSLSIPGHQKLQLGTTYRDGKRNESSPYNGGIHIKTEEKGKLVKQENKVKPELDEVIPGSTFYDFSSERKGCNFQEGQIWALYDNEDQMPRFYAKINSIISYTPLKMLMSWLSWRYTKGFHQYMKWVDLGFTVTCGDFLPSKQEQSETLYSFSHVMEVSSGLHGIKQIYPRQNQVWALYRNWSREWNENTPVDVVRKYDFVEILQEYDNNDKDSEAHVIHLTKVDGFESVFRLCPLDVKKIKKKEILRFSHQVPAHMLTGVEGVNAPSGYWELDPVALPKDFQANEEGRNAAAVTDQPIEDLLKRLIQELVDKFGETSAKKESQADYDG